jgi:oxygen-independent coproporphyrinogen-3 oxidase
LTYPTAQAVPLRLPPADPALPLGLYIHVPFCERKCPYCDFNTYAGLQARFAQTVDALCRELEEWAAPLTGRPITSIFIGGGTPTVLAAEELTRLFHTVQRHYALAPDCEITCEANPGTVDRPKFQLLRDLGVNRLSLGVQSFQPDELAFLGRIHDVEDVYRAFAAARAAGFANINLDFIFGLPHQPPAAWADTLAQALALGPDHLSLYSLIVEPNTPLQHWVESGQVEAPDDDAAGALYEMALEQLAAAGYVHYEVSNWARTTTPRRGDRDGPDDASDNPTFACRHNLLYWRNQEYVGVGPGAHSHMRVLGPDEARLSRRWSNRKPVPGYSQRMLQGASVIDFGEDLTPRVSMGESMLLGLRLVREGVAFARFQAQHGADLRAVFAEELARLEGWGLLTQDGERVRLSRRGLMVGNQVFASFV